MTRIGISLIFMLLLAACGAGASPEEINCTPPFFTIHFSYEITFQRVR